MPLPGLPLLPHASGMRKPDATGILNEENRETGNGIAQTATPFPAVLAGETNEGSADSTAQRDEPSLACSLKPFFADERRSHLTYYCFLHLARLLDFQARRQKKPENKGFSRYARERFLSHSGSRAHSGLGRRCAAPGALRVFKSPSCTSNWARCKITQNNKSTSWVQKGLGWCFRLR